MTLRTVLFTLVSAAATALPATAQAIASAELYSTKAHFYGRFEARLRFAPGDGVISSFFLWKEGSEAANAFWNELDFEKVGASCALQTNAFYGNPESVHEQEHSVADLCGGYHDYRFDWTPSYIAWSIDGKEIRRDTGATANAFAQNASAGMTMHFNVWPGNADFGGNINNTSLPVRQYLSWVQYSSYDNGTFNVQWREEFQTSGIPTGWAVGNWVSPYKQSTHNTQNVGFVNGIAILSLTADNATGNPGVPPADPAASSTGGAAGTGGVVGTGGTTGSGGVAGTGGTTGSGGAGAGGTTGKGGTTGSGGAQGSSTGGRPSTGGATGAGGVPGSGGTQAAGGTTTTGSTSSAGGASASGGAGGASATNAGGAGGADTTGAGGSNTPAGSGGTVGSGGATEEDPPGTGATSDAGDAGCSCSAGRAPSHLLPIVFVLFFAFLRLQRKES